MTYTQRIKLEDKLRVRRLTLLREIIVTVEEDKLHMKTFVHHAQCGTAYCAAGWAAQHPYFKRIHMTLSNLCRSPNPFGILERTFCLSREDTVALFAGNLEINDPDHCASKQEVIDNIDRLLRGEPAVPYKTGP